MNVARDSLMCDEPIHHLTERIFGDDGVVCVVLPELDEPHSVKCGVVMTLRIIKKPLVVVFNEV